MIFGFQSLLSWIAPRQRDPESRTYWGKASCFNPCCRGLSPHRPVAPVGLTASRGFNPCCRGLSLVGTVVSPMPSDSVKVSILVVVDWSRQQLASASHVGIGPGFQSLLSWIGRLNRAHRSAERTAGSWFQSLLSWIGRAQPYLGSGSWWTEPLFQSLLSWISPVGLLPTMRLPRRRSGFNPCCRGSAPRQRSLRSNRLWSSTLFQSLLSWIGRRQPTDCSACHRLKADVFQSLLSWIGRPAASRRSVSIGSFNPCCRGCFNPCCRGSVASIRCRGSAMRPSGPTERQRCFNPCCRGLVAPIGSSGIVAAA